jgi:hypothetical protein
VAFKDNVYTRTSKPVSETMKLTPHHKIALSIIEGRASIKRAEILAKMEALREGENPKLVTGQPLSRLFSFLQMMLLGEGLIAIEKVSTAAPKPAAKKKAAKKKAAKKKK